MGMILALHGVSDQNIRRILESPILIRKLIAVDDPDLYRDVLEQRSKMGFFSRLFGKKGSGDQLPVEDLGPAQGVGPECGEPPVDAGVGQLPVDSA